MTIKKLFLIIAFCLICPEVLAGIGFTVGPSDKSQQYIGMIFGSSVGAINLVADSYNATLSLMFQRFNFVVLVMGVASITYHKVLSTMKSSHEGEEMQKKISMWTPIRIFFGIIVMVPGPTSGYSFIQMFILWVVLNGIGAANVIWNIVLKQLSLGVSASQGVTLTINSPTLNMMAQSVMFSNTCMYAINNLPDITTIPGPYQTYGPVQAYVITNNAIAKPASNPTSITQDAYLMVGLKGAPAPYNSVCGQFKVSTAVAPGDQYVAFNIASVSQVTTTKIAALQAMFTVTDNGAQTLSTPIPSYAQNYNAPDPGYIYAAIQAYTGQMSQIALGVQQKPTTATNAWEQYPQTNNSINKLSALGSSLANLSAIGWIHAGSYYFELVKASTASTAPQASQLPTLTMVPLNASFVNAKPPAQWPTTDGTSTTAISLLNNAQATSFNTALENVATYNASDANVTPSMVGLTASNASTGNALMDAMIGGIRSGLQNPIINYIQGSMTGDGTQDHLVAAGIFGTEIMLAAEVATFAVIFIGFLASILASIMSCVNPAGFAVTSVLIQITPVLCGVFTIMWTFGATLGIYLPMIPYVVFTTTAFGWLISVVESIVGAPILALALMHPPENEEHDKIGQAKEGLVIIVNLFLRPCLMIFGFVMAANLLKAGIAMVNFGFIPALNEGTRPSVFSVLAVLGMYAALLSAIANKSFSLIYMLPNQIIRWIGGQGETFDPSDMVKETKQGFESGAQKGEAALGKLNEFGSDMGNKAVQKMKDKGGGQGSGLTRKDKKALKQFEKENETYQKQKQNRNQTGGGQLPGGPAGGGGAGGAGGGGGTGGAGGGRS